MGNALFSNAKRSNIKIMIAMLDIDFFKRINDTYGHDVGDIAIVAVAKAISKGFRTSDIVARMGGEEFCIIAINNAAPVETMDRIRQFIEAMPIPLNENESINLTISIGVTTTLFDTMDQMINHADQALYTAKQSGRNQVVLS